MIKKNTGKLRPTAIIGSSKLGPSAPWWLYRLNKSHRVTLETQQMNKHWSLASHLLLRQQFMAAVACVQLLQPLVYGLP